MDADEPTVITITPLEAEAVRVAVEAVPCAFPLFAAGSPFAFAPAQAPPAKPRYTPAEFAALMWEHFQGDYDKEAAHCNADRDMCELLRSLGYGEGADVFQAAPKHYS
jgi:hypothetical protein